MTYRLHSFLFKFKSAGLVKKLRKNLVKQGHQFLSQYDLLVYLAFDLGQANVRRNHFNDSFL